MRRLFPLLLFAFLVAACAPGEDAAPEAAPVAPAGYDVYGDAFAADDALDARAVIADRDAYVGETITVRGTAHEVCKMAGCWLTFDGGEAGGLRIRVPRGESGYVFTVPTDIAGREVVVRGTVEAAELSAEDAAHYAEDAARHDGDGDEHHDGADGDGDEHHDGGDADAPAEAAPVQELQMTASGVLVRAA